MIVFFYVEYGNYYLWKYCEVYEIYIVVKIFF